MTPRRPQAFNTDDPKLNLDEPQDEELIDTLEAMPDEDLSPPYKPPHGLGWGAILLTSLGGLITLAAGLWVTNFIENLFSRNDWIGWAAMAFLALAIFAALMIALREILGLMRLRRIANLRQTAERAILDNKLDDARRAIRNLKALYRSRTELSWGLARLKDHQRHILDAKDLLTLGERELLAPLDADAKRIVASSARRISIVTAISPAPVVDILFVGVENIRMLHRLATLYGGKPGAIGVYKLARMVLTHLALTGGLALSGDLIQQLIGHKLTAKLSARLGEGIFNGALCARIGIAAIQICRPLPFLEASPPRFRDFLSELTRSKPKS